MMRVFILRRFFSLALLASFLGLTQFVLGSEAAAEKEIRVYIEPQTLVALENGEEVYSFDIVSGQPGKETTLGTFDVLRKHEKYTSKAYGSEMPYSMFFSIDGKAIHGTHMSVLRSYLHAYLNESVGSKGCIGLTDDNAKALFDWAPVGTPIIILATEE